MAQGWNYLIGGVVFLVAFLLPLMVLEMGFVISSIIGVALGAGTTLALSPKRFSFDIDNLGTIDPKRLEQALQQAEERTRQLKAHLPQIQDEEVKEDIEAVVRLTAVIIDSVRQTPKTFKKVERFLDYFLSQTLKIVDQYIRLLVTGMNTKASMEVLAQAKETLDNLRQLAEKQMERLLKNEVVNFKVELKVLEHTIKSEGI